MSTKVHWTYYQDNNDSIFKAEVSVLGGKNGITDRENTYKKAIESFIFKIKRIENEMNEEILDIKCFCNDKPKGNVITDIKMLEKDIIKFMSYGVVFDPIVYKNFVKEIENNYYGITIEKVSKNSIDESVLRVMEMIIDDIFTFADKKTQEIIDSYNKSNTMDEITENAYINIPVQEFNDLISETEYKQYINRIKSCLLRDGYIKASKGRTSTTVRLDIGKTKRVIQFILSKILQLRDELNINNSNSIN